MPDPHNPNPEEEYRPEPVPPAPQEPAEQAPNVVPPAAEAPAVEQVYDYTQGGDQPQVYEQPAAPIDPYTDNTVHQPAPEPAPAPTPMNIPAPSPPSAAMHRPKGIPPRRKGAKKKVVTGGGRPGYRGRPNQPTYQAPTGGGFSVMSVLMMLVALALLVVAVMVLTPSNLSDIKGYASSDANLEQKEPRNLLKEAQDVMLGDEEIKFTEEEVNQYLSGRLRGSQGGVFGSMMKFKGVCIDFTPGVAEVYIERSFFGIPVTMSSRVRLNKSGSATNWETAGGRIGKLNLDTEKQFAPILEAFLRLAATCKEETTVIDSMSKVKFEEDMLVLDSR